MSYPAMAKLTRNQETNLWRVLYSLVGEPTKLVIRERTYWLSPDEAAADIVDAGYWLIGHDVHTKPTSWHPGLQAMLYDVYHDLSFHLVQEAHAGDTLSVALKRRRTIERLQGYQVHLNQLKANS